MGHDTIASMPPRAGLAVCPKCVCHAKLTDSQCPCCGAVVRTHEWLMPAAILAMGLTAASCGTESGSAGAGASGQGGAGGQVGAGGIFSHGEDTSAAGYTGAASVDSSAGVGGAGGAGGEGGAGGN